MRITVSAPVLLLLSACLGVVGDPGGSDDAVPPIRGGDYPPPPVSIEECSEADLLDPGERRVRRLTAAELDQTISDLLGDDSAPGSVLGADEDLAGYAANAIAPLDETQVDAWMDAAEQLGATAAALHGATWLACDRSQSTCVRPWLTDFGRRAWRRPLTSDELDGLVAFHEDARSQWGQDDALALTVQVMLSSPDFLYHVEAGASAEGEIVPLSGFERASALSYYLWGTMPDEALLDAAAAGELDGEAGVQAHAARMLDDPRASASLESFARQWLVLADASDLAKDASIFPFWDGALARTAVEGPVRFFEQVVRAGDGRFATVMAAPYGYGDAALADVYGAGAPDADGRIDLDPAERAGVLTTPGFIASHSHAAEPSWVHRGKFVREQLLCQPLPSPPPGVDDAAPNDPDRLTTPECSACHLLMDPIGVGFEEYDAVGRFQATGAPGEIVGGEELGLPERFDGAVELAHALSDSQSARECFSTQWFRYALRRAEDRGDACALLEIQHAFEESGGDIRAVVLAIATSKAFTHRRLSPLAP